MTSQAEFESLGVDPHAKRADRKYCVRKYKIFSSFVSEASNMGKS